MHPLIAAMGRAVVAFDGLFTTTSGSSPVTSSSRTATKGGRITFTDVATTDGTPQYDLNGGGFTNITEGLSVNIAKGASLTVRAALGTPSLTAFFRIRSNGVLIENVTLTRS